MLAALALFFIGYASPVLAQESEGETIVERYNRLYPFISMKDSIYTCRSEFEMPDGYDYTDSLLRNSFQNWIAAFPLWHRYKRAGIWRGGIRYQPEEMSRVVHLPWRGSVYKDFNFPWRILAEYFAVLEQPEKLVYMPRIGELLTFPIWLSGKPLYKLRGELIIKPDVDRTPTLKEYYGYMAFCMQNSNYATLAKNCDSINLSRIGPGDLIIAHDSTHNKGTTYIVMNTADNKRGERMYIVATGCDDACDLHIPLLGLSNDNPWITSEQLAALTGTYPFSGFFRLKAVSREK